MPAEDAEHKVGHKYPFRVSAIFDLELNAILDKFFEAAEPVSSDEKNEDGEEDNDTVKVVEGLEDLGDSDMTALKNEEEEEITAADPEETSPTNDENAESSENVKTVTKPDSEEKTEEGEPEKTASEKEEEKGEEKESATKSDDEIDMPPEETTNKSDTKQEE